MHYSARYADVIAFVVLYAERKKLTKKIITQLDYVDEINAAFSELAEESRKAKT